jgi:hypothetical protein
MFVRIVLICYEIFQVNPFKQCKKMKTKQLPILVFFTILWLNSISSIFAQVDPAKVSSFKYKFVILTGTMTKIAPNIWKEDKSGGDDVFWDQIDVSTTTLCLQNSETKSIIKLNFSTNNIENWDSCNGAKTNNGTKNILHESISTAALPAPYDENFPITVESVPDIPQSEVNDVMNWIKYETTKLKFPFCYRQSYTRDAGSAVNTCPPGTVKEGALCYSTCPSGYSGALEFCYQNCPSGFTNDGLYCRKPASYNPINVGRITEKECEGADKNYYNTSCYKEAGLWYPACKSGFHNVGALVCSPNCPPGFGDDIGVSCRKKTTNRTTSVMKCQTGKELDGALCYDPCKADYHGVGPVCWQNCDVGTSNCASGCAGSKYACVATTIDMVLSVAVVAANIATLGMATGPTAAGQTAVKVAGKTYSASSKIGKAFLKAIDILQSVDPKGLAKNATIIQRIQFAKFGTKFKGIKTAGKFTWSTYSAVSDFQNEMEADFINQTSAEINAKINSTFTDPATQSYLKRYWGLIRLSEMSKEIGFEIGQIVLSFVSIVDISGVTGIVSAYMHPTCPDIVRFPELSQVY